MSTEDVASKQGTLGELKLVGKVRKPFICADCNKAVLIGNSCYDQSDYRGPGFFPEKIRICVDCGEIKMKGGTAVKKKPVKAPKKEKVEDVVVDPKDGCGKDTEYPKPDGSGVWKCGEKAPVVGIMHCKGCGGLK